MCTLVTTRLRQGILRKPTHVMRFNFGADESYRLFQSRRRGAVRRSFFSDRARDVPHSDTDDDTSGYRRCVVACRVSYANTRADVITRNAAIGENAARHRRRPIVETSRLPVLIASSSPLARSATNP